MEKKPYRREKDWFKPKSYQHIGLPLRQRDRDWVEKYVQDPKKIASHSFLPFIYRKIEKKKFRRDIHSDGTRSKKRVRSTKTRHIYYASHLDSQIYSYYSELLRQPYESKLQELGIEDCVTAYRRIPAKEEKRNKCNIDFAKEAFDFIKNWGECEVDVITLDIKSFFDSLDHKILKKRWYDLIGAKKNLRADHYNLYKNLTRYSFVNENQLFNEFHNDIIVQMANGSLKRKKISRSRYLNEKNAIAYCFKQEFKDRIKDKGLVNESTLEKRSKIGKKIPGKFRKMGIPQGTPLSAMLANIYMINFDHLMNQELKKIGGVYRRYSDDMIIICSPEDSEKLEEDAMELIDRSKLKIQPEKTRKFRFKKNDTGFDCSEWMPKSGIWYPNTNLEYLGFEFDGKRALIKSSSISKFYRNMKRSVRRSAFFANFGKSKDDNIYKRKLFKRFSHLGAGRRQIYKRDKNDETKWSISYKYNWGNFITYVRLAEKIFNNSDIRGQLKNHWKKLNKEIDKHE